MSTEYDRGPLLPYEVTWRSGHIETVMAHQVLMPHDDSSFNPFGSIATKQRQTPRIMFHAEIDGHWGLVLAADEADVISVRRLFPAAEATS